MRTSFIIPAHNESALLPATLDALFASAHAIGSAHETIVVDDASTDDTGTIAASSGARVATVDRRQISAVRNAGASIATGDVFIFIDADTRVNIGALRDIRNALDRGADYGGAPIRFDDPCPRWARALLPVMMLAYRSMSLAPGCCFFVRRECFERVGGYDETVFAGEEVLFARSLRRAGARHALIRTPVETSGRKLRDASGGKILGVVARLGLKGKRGVRSRDGLELWYDQRRSDSTKTPPDGDHRP